MVPHMKQQGRDGAAGRHDELGYSERLNDDDTASAVSKVRRRGSSRARNAPSVCSSVRGSNITISGLRLRRASQLAGGRRRGPSTPVPSWKLVGDIEHVGALALGRHSDAQHHHHHLQAERPSAATVSARRLAAALWELQAVPLSRGGVPHSRDSHHRQHSKSSANVKQSELISQPQSPASSRMSEGLLKGPLTQNKMEPSRRAFPAAKPSPTMKALLKELAQGPTTSNEFVKVLNHVRMLEDQHRSSNLLVEKLHRELDQSRSKLQELLQIEKEHSVEVEEITKKLVEERAVWQERKKENVRLAVQSAQEELYHERKAKGRLESLHKRLAKEFQELNKALGKALHDLERERKARELMEDVCDELAREIGEDKARVEEMKRESAKVREEVEEERKMLQMAEIWREERVQMKLMEAKLELEEKNTALDKLRGELEAFLKAKRVAATGHHMPVDTRQDEHSRLVQEAILGHNLADPFHPIEARAPARHSIDSRLSNLNGAKQNAKEIEEDNGSSAGEDDLHSISISNELLSKQDRLQRSRFQHHQRDGGDRDRRSSNRSISVAERYKHTQEGQHQGLQRSKSSQLREGDRHIDRYLADMQGTPWIEDKAERREWSEGQHPVCGDDNAWPSENEGSQGHPSFSPRPGGRMRTEPYEESNNLESSGTNAAWLRQIVESSRDLPATSAFAPMHHQLYAKSSPTCHWNHFWSSPGPGSPRQAKSKGSSEMSGSLRDNSLKAKLLEAKLEGEQARFRAGMG
ncbi:hypothetical protein L7F22_024679 [Adiantum nelumboides]|nr:hypothetical protein [Adiantum nelumboides]